MPDFERLQDALTLPPNKYGPKLRPVIQLIDSIHRTYTTYQIPIVITKNKRNQGEYHYRRGTFEPEYIEISRVNDSMETTLLHEIGHFLEHAVIPGCHHGQRQWKNTSLTGDWLESVHATATFKLLGQIIDEDEWRAPYAGDESAEARVIRRRWVGYLMTPRELWARTYAQWIVERGNHAPFRRVLIERSSPSAVVPLQWSQDDFAPVHEQFDRLFARLGWLR